MKKNSNGVCETYKYGVDGNDIVVGLSENWQTFSEENGGGEGCYPKNIIGSSLWRHVCEWETKHLYEIILEKVREHNHRATFSFRCDSPEKRRFLTLAVIPMDEASIAFESTIINTEFREPVVLLKEGINRSKEFLRICSMCKKIAISSTEWVEVEVAVQELGLFQEVVMPQFTHGVCQSCFDAAMAELDNLRI
jgi:hypothetical protein